MLRELFVLGADFIDAQTRELGPDYSAHAVFRLSFSFGSQELDTRFGATMPLTFCIFAVMLASVTGFPAFEYAAEQVKSSPAETRTTSVKFEGRAVTVTIPKTDKDGFFPEGPSTVCIEGPRQCYTAPPAFGIDPQVQILELSKGKPALFFTASSGGVSGHIVHFALLRPGRSGNLDNILYVEAIGNQNEHAFWMESEISASPIFVVADAIWGPDETHYSEHRFVISAFVLLPSSLLDDPQYFLDDRYMTVRKYNQDANDQILQSERTEILTRLTKAKAERERKK
jgi:hypothetical protein